MKNKLVLIILIVAISVALFSTASFAEEKKMKPGPIGRNPGFTRQGERSPAESGDLFKLIEDLELSKEQITEIRERMLALQKDSLKLKSQVQMKQLEIQEFMLESDIDMDRVREKLEEIADLQVELKVQGMENLLKIREILTEEQLEKLSLGFPMQKFGMEKFKFNRRLTGNHW